MAQPNLRVVSPAPTAAATWPDTGDVSDLLGIVQAQTITIADQADLLDRYQSVLNAAQTMPGVATGLGTSTGTTSLTVTGSSGAIVAGAAITGVGVPAAPPATTIVSGPGGDGTYITNNPTTIAAGTALAFAPPSSVSPWPIPRDPPTLNLLAQQQTAVSRTQTALIQHYQDVLNTAQMPPT